MNRPKIHEIAKQIDDMNLITTKYIIDLEKYCDELERQVVEMKKVLDEHEIIFNNLYGEGQEDE